MRYFPINFDIRDREVIVVGGGAVAARKCRQLLDAGARITVVAPELEASLIALRENGQIGHRPRPYQAGDLLGATLAFAATDSPEVNRVVARDGKAAGIPVNVADAPELCDFTSPAVITRGELLITVSTGGKSPALSASIRAELEERFGREYATALDLLGAVREKLLTESADNAYNKQILNNLANCGLPELFRNGNRVEIDRILLQLAGPGYSLAELGTGEKDPR